jgi:hypothetical protein
MDTQTEAIRAAWRLGLRIAERTGYDLEPRLTVHRDDQWYIAMRLGEEGPLIEFYSLEHFNRWAERVGMVLAEAPL